MNTWIDIVLPFIQGFESCSLTAYHGKADRPGLWSIGWGTTGPGIVEGLVWTQDQCDQALLSRVLAAGASVDSMVTVPLTPYQKAALVSFAYNCGIASLQHSTLLTLLNEHEYNAASIEFPKWNHADGVVVAGLTRRREAEQALFNKVDDNEPQT